MISSRSSILFLIFFSICFSFGISVSEAQDFEQGLQFYQQKEFEKAAAVFNTLNTQEGYLFTGKSFYALGRYEDAQSNLNNISEDAPPQIYLESNYTSALIDFQQKRFAEALGNLYEVSRTATDSDLAFKAKDLYGQILNYLTGGQRLQAMESLSSDSVHYDLLESALGKVPFGEADELYNVFRDEVENDELREQAEQFESTLADSAAYRSEYGQPAERLRPPEGTIYTIGIALPKYKPEEPEYDIVKGMYFGAMLAAEEFNNQNPRIKSYLRFVDTGTDDEKLESATEQFVNQYRGDALIGPLFSKQAEPMVSIANDFEIPVIAPLANSQINDEGSYLFQANPTFEVHGREMARYAVRNLGLKNFAVLADENSNGLKSAEAFRDEAEELGAFISHYVVENLNANQFEISRQTREFGSSPRPIEAVYAPFTGQGALTLVDLLLADLGKMNKRMTVLGSQEYQNLDFRSSKYDKSDVYFSESTYQESNDPRIAQFKSKYQQEFGTSGNMFSFIGYDVTRFILQTLQKVGNPERARSEILTHPLYRGLVTDIQFRGSNVNKALKILKVSSGGDVSNVR